MSISVVSRPGSAQRPPMHAMRRHAQVFLVALCTLGALAGPALAQQSGKLPPADEKALREYTIKADTLDRAFGVVQDARREKIKGSNHGDAKTLDDIANGLNADPKAKSVLEKNQISARDYIMTMIALNRAGAAVQANAKSPADAGTNAANMAYVKANKGRIGAAMTAGRDAKADAAKAEAAKANAAKSDAAKPEAAKPDAAAK